MNIKQKITRFRAYQLGNAGSSFSYYDGSALTLIEARLTDMSRPNVMFELEQAGKEYIDTLHITSWDNDHCRPVELKEILETLLPSKIESPGYEPHTDSGKTCLGYIEQYQKHFINKSKNVEVQTHSPDFINNLDSASTGLGYSDILYHPRELCDSSNDNSTVKLFRSGSFTVLSLGDVEKEEIAKRISSGPIACTQVDVMILAHHGAANGFTTDQFVKAIKPRIAICSSNYANQFLHPKQEIRDLLYHNDIKLLTTKTGDIVIKSINDHVGECQIYNLAGNNTVVSSQYLFNSKRLD